MRHVLEMWSTLNWLTFNAENGGGGVKNDLTFCPQMSNSSASSNVGLALIQPSVLIYTCQCCTAKYCIKSPNMEVAWRWKSQKITSWRQVKRRATQTGPLSLYNAIYYKSRGFWIYVIIFLVISLEFIKKLKIDRYIAV